MELSIRFLKTQGATKEKAENITMGIEQNENKKRRMYRDEM